MDRVATQPDAPRVIATVGLHASASTWVFNVVRELMIAAQGDSSVQALYAEEIAELPPATLAAEHLVIKSHHGSDALDAWLTSVDARLILSIRDPRDACVSMSQRFRAPLARSVQWLTVDCNRMMRLAVAGQPLLRYEDRFFEKEESVRRLAGTLGLALESARIATIAARYHTEAVRAFATKLTELPGERLIEVASGHLADRVTHIHTPHIGDARSGKWRGLPGPAQEELTRRFGPFLERFGYPR